MILVTGATGNVGSALVRRLAAKRTKFRVFVRDASRAEEAHRAGAELAVGDLGDKESLRAALAGVERLFLLTPPSPDIARVEAGVAQEARRAGLRHVVKLSAWGAGHTNPPSIPGWHREAEVAIERTGVAFTHLRPNFFMQNFLMFADGIRSQGTFYAPAGEARISAVDVADVAAVAARALTSDGHSGRVYEISGPAAFTHAAAAETIARVTGRPAVFVHVPDDAARQAMLTGGMPAWFVDGMIGFYRFFREGNGENVTATVRKVTGRAPRDFETFARESAAAFGG